MNGLVSYLMTVTAAAVLAAVLLTLAGKGPMSGLIRLLAGVFMALTVVSPLLKLELPDMESWLSSFSADGEYAAALGEEMAAEAERSIIKARVETYIMDKAAGFGASLRVDAELDGAGILVGVTLTGAITPEMKAQLARIIETDLGIGKEAQRWTA